MASTYDVDRYLRRGVPQTRRPRELTIEPPSVGGWFEAVGGEIARQPVWQWAGALLEENTRDDPDYDPYSDPELEPYMSRYDADFIDVGSRAEAMQLTARIRRNEERRAASERELGLGGILLAELFNPVNYIPLPGLKGAGLIKGALRGSTSFGALLTAEELARHGIDPTATTAESVDNIVYGSIFGGLIGGIAGPIGAKDINRLAGQYQAEHQRIVRGDAPATGGEAFIKSGTMYEAKPTGPEGAGVAPAFGLEKVTQMTLWGQLKASKIRSVGDLADVLLGDFGTKSTQNAAGEVTAPSVTLAAGYWRGLAADGIRAIEHAYVQYRLGGPGTRIAGLNVPVTGARIGEFFGRKPADGKMSFAEFKEQVFRAHKADGIAPDADPHVKAAAQAVRSFFDTALEDGLKKGTIRSAEGFQRVLTRRVERARQMVERQKELLAKADADPNARLALAELERSMQRTMDWLSARLMDDLADDAGLADALRQFEAEQLQRRADMAATAKDIRSKGKKRRESTQQAMHWVDEMIARDREILRYLNQLEVQRGLTDKQLDYRDDLEAALDNLGTVSEREAAMLEKRAKQISPKDFVRFGMDTEISAVIDENGKLWKINPTDNPSGDHAAFGDALLDIYPDLQGIERFDRYVRVRQYLDQVSYDFTKLNEQQAQTIRALRAQARREQAEVYGSDPIPNVEGKPSFKDETNFLNAKEKAYLDGLEQRLANKQQREPFTGPKNENAYLPRFWRIDKVLEDEAGEQRLRAILRQWFIDNPLEGVSMSPAMIDGRVEQAIANIVKDGELDEMQLFKDGAGAGMMSQKARALDIPNELVADFIENDVEKIMRTYSHRFGVINEMTGMLGDTDALDAIDDALIQAALEVDASDVGKAADMLAGTRADLERARDTLTGRIYSTEPEMMNARRRAQVLRAYGITTSLGGAALSSIPELGRGLMVHGFARTFGAIFDGLGNPAAVRGVTNEMRTFTGEGNDALMATAIARVVEQGGPTGAATTGAGKAAHRFADFASGPFFNLNLLAPFTDWTKQTSLFWTNQFFLEDLAKLAETGDAELATRMASYGLSLEDARAIMAQPVSREGRIYEANLGEWTDDALALKYRTAVAGMVRRIIPTASNADIPEIAKGFIKGREYPLVTLPFQFMAYGFAAVNKVMISGLQGRDRSAMLGVAAMLALGWITEAIKVPEYIWDQMSTEEKALRAFDRAGLVGIFSDVPTMVETATLGQVGLRPLMGLEPYVRNPDGFDALGELGGPVVSRAADIVRLFVDPETDADDVGGTVRRSIPLNQLFYWKGLWADLEQTVVDAVSGEPELAPAA